MQGYLAYTAELGWLNVDFLRSPRAPQWIYFDVQNIDEWYPSLGDALCWPELLSRYRVRDVRQSALLLERAARPADVSYTSLRKMTARLGDWVEIPDASRPVWGRIIVKPTLTGRLAGSFYKPPELDISYVTTRGLTGRARLIPGIAAGGFLLSPLVPDRHSFAMLYAGDWKSLLQNQVVRQIQIAADTSDGMTAAYEPEYELELSELHFATQDMTDVAGMTQYLRFRDFVQQARPIGGAVKRVVMNDAGEMVLQSPPPTRWLMEVPGSASIARVRFGVMGSPGSVLVNGSATEFRLYAARMTAQNALQVSPIWSGRVNAPGEQVADVQLPSPPPSLIVLETEAGSAAVAAPSYWSDLDFR
jgi:hypothetical protein